MLTLTVGKDGEFYDEVKDEFIYVHPTTLQLEHSLLSVKKWEANWKIPFFSDKPKTSEQTTDYIRCMTLTQNVNPLLYKMLTRSDIQRVNDYIVDPMTATWFNEEAEKMQKKKRHNEVVTAERIYYWMVAYHIPFECQKWNFNQLITLIRVCNEENNPSKPLKGKDLYKRNRDLNEARKTALKTKG